jgi:hypothetical protein
VGLILSFKIKNMKKTIKKVAVIILAATIGLSVASFTKSKSQQTDYALARTNKINNKLAFFLCEPANEYEVAFTFKNLITNINCASPQQILAATIQNANYEASNQNKLYDAVILGNTERDMAIVWKDKTKDNSIARVKKVEGKLLFVECEPIANYDVTAKYDVSGAGQKIMTGTCPSQDEKIAKIMKKAGKEKINYDGVMYGSSKNDLVIKFK